MAKAAPPTNIDLAKLALSSGEGARLELPVRLGEIEIAGQSYAPRPETVAARIEISRLSQGYAFRLSFPLAVQGPCMRCLEAASVTVEVEAREVDQAETEDEELRSPYVEDHRLDVRRWARDAAVLVLPAQILCRTDCAGLCPVCGEPLGVGEDAGHRHEESGDPRWAKLRDLKLE